MRIKSGRDLATGLMFIAVGLAGLWIGADYAMGIPQRPGTGVLPRILSWCLLGTGAALLGQSLFSDIAALSENSGRTTALLAATLAAAVAVYLITRKLGAHPVWAIVPVALGVLFSLEGSWRGGTVIVGTAVVSGIIATAAAKFEFHAMWMVVPIGIGFLLLLETLGMSIAWRPFGMVTLGVCSFGFLIDQLGLVLTMIISMTLCALGSLETRWREFGVFMAIMLAIGVGTFILLLGMPIPTWPSKIPSILQSIFR